MRSSYYQLTRENDELKSRLSEMTMKLQTNQDNISSLLESNQKLLEQNVDLMGRSFDSPADQSRPSQEAILMMNSLNTSATEEQSSLKVELASTRTREAECQRQIEKLIRMDQTNKQQLQQIDLQLKDLSQTSDRLSAELNAEKKRRKEAEMTSRTLATDAEETKAKNVELQKTLSDLKTSSKLKITELENDAKNLQDNNQKEMSFVKERFRKEKSRLQAEHSEMLRQTEESLRSSWKRKYENLEKTSKERHSLQLEELSTEKSFLVDRVATLEQKMAEMKFQRTAEQSSRAELLSEMEEYKTWKAKFDNLRSQAIAMKDRYVDQMNELREENNLLEEKSNRMTEKYYKAEESLNIANQKYEEFKASSLDGRRELEDKVVKVEAELVMTKSELDVALRRGVQTQLELDEATNKYLRLVERSKELEKEQKQETSHVAQKSTSAPLVRIEDNRVQGNAASLCSPLDDTKECSLTLLDGASNICESKPIVERLELAQEHDVERKEEEEQEQERPEVSEPEVEDDVDDGDSFVTAFDEDDANGSMDWETEDVTWFEETLCVDIHFDLETIDLDVAPSSFPEQESGTRVDTSDLEEAKTDSEANDLEIQHFANDVVKAGDIGLHFDLIQGNDLEGIDVTPKENKSNLTLPNRTLPAISDDLSSYESTSIDLPDFTIEYDLQSGVDLEETKKRETGVILHTSPDNALVSPPAATEAGPTVPTLNRNSDPEPETPSNQDPAAPRVSFTTENGGFEHEVGMSGQLKSTVHDEVLSRPTAESGLLEPVRSPCGNDKNCDKDTIPENPKVEENDWTSGKLGTIEAGDQLESQKESLPATSSSAQSKDGVCDDGSSGEVFKVEKHEHEIPGKLESGRDLSRQQEEGGGRDSIASVTDKVGRYDDANPDFGAIILDDEDSIFKVTFGGKIVPESDGEAVVRGGWLADVKQGQGAPDTWSSRSPSSKHDPTFRLGVEGTPDSVLDEKKSKQQIGSRRLEEEDFPYTVTSGGQIVSGWTDMEDPIPDGVSHTIPEVDQQQLTTGTTDLDVTAVPKEPSSTLGTTYHPETWSTESGTSEVLETGSETQIRKLELENSANIKDPVSRIGACVILREEDIEIMRERQRNDSTEEKKEKQKKKKSKKIGR